MVFQLILARERPTSHTPLAARKRTPELGSMCGMSSYVVTLEVTPTGIGLIAASRALAFDELAFWVLSVVH
jgi:hypothetical protein